MRRCRQRVVHRSPVAHKRLAVGTVAVVCAVVLLVGSSAGAAATWSVALASNNSVGEAQSGSAPSTPTGVSATCSLVGTAVTVSWSAVVNATTYAVEQSTTSSSSGYSTAVSGLTGTSWTSGDLPSGNYWFEVVAYTGTNWTSQSSVATSELSITLDLVCS